ncbi:MAG TPA: divalent-cation tolerance protein CutA [Terriglobales bacterium]
MTDARLVVTTAGSADEARRLAEALLERRLAACVNILPKVTSIYRWKGKVEESAEWMLWIKTTQALFEAVRDAIKEMHSYELPECICLAVEDGSHEYLEWVRESAGSDSAGTTR